MKITIYDKYIFQFIKKYLEKLKIRYCVLLELLGYY